MNRPQTRVVTCKIAQTAREQLERMALAQGWTLNKLCRTILEAYVDVSFHSSHKDSRDD